MLVVLLWVFAAIRFRHEGSFAGPGMVAGLSESRRLIFQAGFDLDVTVQGLVHRAAVGDFQQLLALFGG